MLPEYFHGTGILTLSTVIPAKKFTEGKMFNFGFRETFILKCISPMHAFEPNKLYSLRKPVLIPSFYGNSQLNYIAEDIYFYYFNLFFEDFIHDYCVYNISTSP